MPIKWREWIRGALSGLLGFASTVLIFGAGQVLISLLVWPIVFGDHPLGFSMALSLVGFGCWGLAFLYSFGGRRRRLGIAATTTPNSVLPVGREGTLSARIQDQVQRSGCGFLLLVSSLVPLAIAFVLRLQADLRAGLTLSDILPPPP